MKEPASFYRSFSDACYGIGCWLGINGLMDDLALLGQSSNMEEKEVEKLIVIFSFDVITKRLLNVSSYAA